MYRCKSPTWLIFCHRNVLLILYLWMHHLALIFSKVFSVKKWSWLSNAPMLKCLSVNSRSHCSSGWKLRFYLYKNLALLSYYGAFPIFTRVILTKWWGYSDFIVFSIFFFNFLHSWGELRPIRFIQLIFKPMKMIYTEGFQHFQGIFFSQKWKLTFSHVQNLTYFFFEHKKIIQIFFFLV